jgi:sigma-B regulation protein RsbU (phosphoserine phosphatase)
MKRVFRPSIWLKLAIFIGVLALLTSGVLIWTAYMFARDMLVDQIHARLTVTTSDRQAMLLAYIHQQHERVRLVASRTRLRQLLEEHADDKIADVAFRAGATPILADAQKSAEDFLVIGIADLAGTLIAATEETYLGKDVSAEPSFVYGQHIAYLGIPQLTRGRYQTFLSGPATAPDGQLLGVIMVVLHLGSMEELLADAAGLGQTGEVMVGTQRGETVRYLLPPLHEPEITEVPLASTPAMAHAIQGYKGFMHTTDYRGVEVLAAYQPVKYQGWGIVAKIDVAEAYAPVERLRLALLVLEAAILLVDLVALYVLARRFTRPIMALARMAAAVAAGNLEARVTVTSSDEIGRLGTTFNHMTEELAASYATLEHKVVERTRELVQANAELANEIAERKRAEEQLVQAHEQEVEIGFKIQQMLLFDQPPRDLPGARVAALTIPSQTIDGDFCDFFKHSDCCLDVIVGDVMGKGIPAALMGAATKSHFLQALCRLIALSPSGKLPEPKEIVTLAHAEVVRQLINLESFVTVCYARFDLERRQVDLVDCGHTTTVHYRHSTKACTLVQGDNMPLGVSEGEIFEQITVPFEPGDVLLFYSDGLTETRDDTGELFGVERLAACVQTHSQLEPEELIDQIRLAVVAFSNSERFGDDLTCVAVKLAEPELPLTQVEIEMASDLQELARARAFVREVCQNLPGTPLDEDSTSQLELAITEATSNIMQHAYGGRTDQRIQIDAEVFADRIVFRLHHLGEAFDPSLVEAPAFDGSREGGFGVYIIAQSVDEVRYLRDEQGRNCIYLVKNRQTT